MDEPNRKVITLIGFRGCGKTSVGRLLADRLGWQFMDTDAEIERKTGKSIAEIFLEQGEDTFRRLEREEMQTQLGKSQLVISAGGGAILDAQTRDHIAKFGVSIWLTAKVETIRERLENDERTQSQRPSLTGKATAAEIGEILQQRNPLYSSSADVVVETDSKSPLQVVEEILSQLPVEFPKG